MGELIKDNIEFYGVGEVAKILRCTNRVVTEIPTGDKSPSWDGTILFYKDTKSKSFNKKDLIAKIPVQVKSTEVQELSSKSTKKYFDRADLENYYNDGGVIIFLVELKDNEDEDYDHKIFYKMLLPLDLRNLLDEMNSQNGKTLKFHSLPKGKNNLIGILSLFANHKKRQSVIHVEKRIDISKVDKFIFTAKEKVTGINDLVGGEGYLYGELIGTGVEVPITNVVLTELKGNYNETIGINGKIFYNEITRKFLKDGIEIEFGNKFTIRVSGKKFTINMKADDSTLEQAILFSEFILHFIKYKHFEINRIKFPCDTIEIDNNYITVIGNNYNFFLKLKKIVDYFNIDLKGDILKLKEKDIDNINLIYDVLYENKRINLKCDKDLSIVYITFIKYQVLFLATRNKEGKYILSDFFKELDKRLIGIIEDDNSKETISPFCNLKPKDIMTSNFDENIIYNSIIKYKLSLKYTDLIINLILNIILAYDDYEVSHLSLAVRLLEYLKDENSIDESLYIINKYQINYRLLGDLSDLERKELIKIKVASKEIDIKCGCCILLGYKDEFEYLFNEMENKDEFKKYPIYNLINLEKYN